MENDSCIYLHMGLPPCATGKLPTKQCMALYAHTCLTSTLTSTPAMLGVTVILMTVNPVVHEVGDDVISDREVWNYTWSTHSHDRL